MPEVSATLPGAAEAALVACLLVTAGSSVGGHLTLLAGIPLTVAGAAIAWVAARRAQRGTPHRPCGWIYFWLSANAAVGLSVGPPYPAPLWYGIAYYGLPALGIVLIAIVASGSARARSRAVWTAVAFTTALVLATPIAMPQPMIDVWTLTQTSVHALLHGIHPYTVTTADVYGGQYDFGYTTSAYPYMPLDLIVAAPAVALFDDYRFALVLCFPITVMLLRSAGRRLAVSPHTLDVLTLALALQPHAAFIVSAGWIEPMMTATLAAFVYLSAREPGGSAAAVAFFLLPALKQYVAAPLLLFLAMEPRPRARAIAAGALVAACTVLPFLVWNWRPTLDGMTSILRHMRTPAAFRTDSDSLTAAAARLFGWRAGAWLGAVAQLAAGAIAFVMLRHAALGGLLLASALALLTSFLLGTQAFVNYYSFAAALLLFAALALSRGEVIAAGPVRGPVPAPAR
jgi:hypothetical protein